MLGATHGGELNGGSGLSVGTNGISVYEHGSGYMPALAVYDGPFAGFGIISVNYSNKHPSLFLQGNQVSAGVVSPRTAVTAPTEIGAGAYGQFAGEVARFWFTIGRYPPRSGGRWRSFSPASTS